MGISFSLLTNGYSIATEGLLLIGWRWLFILSQEKWGTRASILKEIASFDY
jgi:hypothetical protein